MSLNPQIAQFRKKIQAAKRDLQLPEGRGWYPWDSLAGLEMLSRFPGGANLKEMAGNGRILDVGCGDGDVAFFLESLGYPVDAVDYAPSNFNAMVGVQTLKEHFRSQIGIHTVDLDTRPHLPGGTYGFTLLLGVLYHLKNPFLVLETLARHSRHIFLSTRIASLSADRKQAFGSLPVAYLVDEAELNQDRTNFWIFTEIALRRLMERSGWTVLDVMTTGPAASADPVTDAGDVRAYVLAQSRRAMPDCAITVGQGWHEPEEGQWRWTQQRFSLTLDLPAALQPATLRLVFHTTEALIAQRSSVTLSARVNGQGLPPATFTTAGEQEYAALLAALPAGPVEIEFELDGIFHPGRGDLRELGVLIDFSGPAPIRID